MDKIMILTYDLFVKNPYSLWLYDIKINKKINLGDFRGSYLEVSKKIKFYCYKYHIEKIYLRAPTCVSEKLISELKQAGLNVEGV